MTFVEMVPTDIVKYEMDKVSGYLRLDRPQRYSNVAPARREATGYHIGDLRERGGP